MDKENKTEIYATLLDYVENNLPQEKRKEVEEFLEQNPTYKQDVENYDGKITLPMPKRTDNEKKIIPEVIKLKVYSQKMKKQRNTMRVMTTISSVAAVVLLLVMIVPPTQDNIPAIAQNNTKTITKEIRTVDYINDTIYLRDTIFLRDEYIAEESSINENDFQREMMSLFVMGMDNTIADLKMSNQNNIDSCVQMDFWDKDNINSGNMVFNIRNNTVEGTIKYSINSINNDDNEHV